MPDIFDEISEELQHEKLINFWRKYGLLIISSIVILIVTMSAMVGWQHYSNKQKANNTSSYISAVESNSISEFEQFKKEKGVGIAVLAKFKQAEILVENKKDEEAIKIYEEIAGNFKKEIAIHDMAVLFASYILADIDTNRAKEKLNLITKQGRPFCHSAKEVLGMIAIRTKDTTKAKEIFEELSTDATAPETLRDRAKKIALTL